MPGILFGKQVTVSITKNDKNTRTTGHPTLNEVACRTGVSPITASRTLRGVTSAAEELAQKVRSAARELGCVASPVVRALASVQSRSVAVLVSSLANLLFIGTLEAIHVVLRLQDLGVLIGNFHYSRDEEEDLIRNCLAYQPHGLLLTGFERTENARWMIEASSIPCVYITGLGPGAGLNCVGFSQLRANETAAKHLLARGHRYLAYIGTQPDQCTLLRDEGSRRILQKTDCYSPGLEILTPRPSSVALGGELFVQLLASQPQVDGVLFCSDDLVQDALLEALRRGVRVPEQTAVLSSNDLPGLDYTVPCLSSTRTLRKAVSRHAAEQLLVLIAGKEVHDSVLDMGLGLMMREST